MTITLAVLGYLACSFGAWGLTLGHFTRDFPMLDNSRIAATFCAMGPLGLVTAIVGSLAEGGLVWRLIPMTSEEQRAAWGKLHRRLE